MSKKEKRVSVLSFEKKLVPSDAKMYGCKWDNKTLITPLELNEKTVRGTFASRLKPALQKDPLALNKKIESPNLQTVDSCSLNSEQDTLKLSFTLKILGGLMYPAACNNAMFKQSYQSAVQKYINQVGMKELAKRYALNIANARFLWRNRFGAEQIEVFVKVLNQNAEQEWHFNSLEFNTRNFEKTTNAIESLAEKIAMVLESENDFLMLEINCFAKVGKGQDVYPSEELVFDKGKGKKSKILYSVNNIAAMHSQKVGNALRTIDTWYPDFHDEFTTAGPIAIEPYGAVTNLGKAFRTPTEKQDFYTHFDKWARGEALSKVEDEHYVIAILIRGGVFGESGN